MSVTNVKRTADVPSVARYIVVGKSKDGKMRAAALAMSSSTSTDNWVKWSHHVQQASLGNRGRNTNTGVTLVQSWHPDELDKDNPKDVQRALHAATTLAERLAPTSPYLVGIHTDGKGGAVHAHIIIGNHDYSADAPVSEQVSNMYNVRRVNDQIMREMRMQVLDRHPISLMVHERLAQREGREIRAYDDAGQPTPVTPDTWADHLRARVEAATADPRTVDLGTLATAARDYGCEMRIQGSGHKAKITWGLLDERGETQRVRIKTRKRKEKSTACAAPGTRLGTDYTLAHVQVLLAQRAQEQQLQAAQQAVYDEMADFGLDLERITDHGSTQDEAHGVVTDPTAVGNTGTDNTGANAIDPTAGVGDTAGTSGDNRGSHPEPTKPVAARFDTGSLEQHDGAVHSGYADSSEQPRRACAEDEKAASDTAGSGAPDPRGDGTRDRVPESPDQDHDAEQPLAASGHRADDRRGSPPAGETRGPGRAVPEDGTGSRILAEIRRKAQQREEDHRKQEPEIGY